MESIVKKGGNMKNVLLKTMLVVFIQMQNVLAFPPTNPNVNPYYGNSTFEIKSQGANYITVAIDGDYFRDPVKRFAVNNITAGNHYVEIFTERAQHSGYYTSTQSIRIYAGYVYIKSASMGNGVVDNQGRFFVKSVQALAVYQPNYYEPYYPTYPQYEQQQIPVCNMPMGMSGSSFNLLLQTINNQWFDDTKLSVAKQAAQNNWFTTAQVARIMQTFSFEDSKLSLAKMAYSRVIDQSNYFVVYDEFWFSSSVDELIAYIN